MKDKTNFSKKETYISPMIEVVNIETEQNILLGGSGEGSGDLPGMPGSPW